MSTLDLISTCVCVENNEHAIEQTCATVRITNEMAIRQSHRGIWECLAGTQETECMDT